MARPKKSEINTTSIVENEKETIEAETPVVEEVKEPVKQEDVTEAATETKPKKSGGNVFVKHAALAGRKLSLPTRVVEFDENGKCEVTEEESKRLLSIPGYELA